MSIAPGVPAGQLGGINVFPPWDDVTVQVKNVGNQPAVPHCTIMLAIGGVVIGSKTVPDTVAMKPGAAGDGTFVVRTIGPGRYLPASDGSVTC